MHARMSCLLVFPGAQPGLRSLSHVPTPRILTRIHAPCIAVQAETEGARYELVEIQRNLQEHQETAMEQIMEQAAAVHKVC